MTLALIIIVVGVFFFFKGWTNNSMLARFIGVFMLIVGGLCAYDEYERQKRLEAIELERELQKQNQPCPVCNGYGCQWCGYKGYTNNVHFGGSLDCKKCNCHGWAGSSKSGICGRKIGAYTICNHTYVEHCRAGE